jgi:WD40 repeat protein
LLVVGTLACSGVLSAPSGEHSGPHEATIQSVAVSPVGNLVATAGQDRVAKVWTDAGDGSLQGVRDLYHEDFVTTLAFSPDGRRLATGGYGPEIVIWDTASWEPVGRIPRSVLSLDWSGDRIGLAIVRSASVEVWNATTLTIERTLDAHVDSVHAVRFSPDGTKLATGSKDRSIRLWDLASGEEVGMFAGHDEAVLALAFSADGERLASGSADKMARLWDVATQEPIRQLAGHRDRIVGVDIDPTGRLLVTASPDGLIRAWDARSGRDAATVALDAGAFEDVRFLGPDSVVAVGEGLEVVSLAEGLESHTYASDYTVPELDERCARLVACGKALVRDETTNGKGVEVVRIAREMNPSSPELCLTTLLTIPTAVGDASPPECSVGE